jgi:hypothetical protein
MGKRLLARTARTETYRNGNLDGIRQPFESINQILTGQLDPERHGGRTPLVFTRGARRLSTMAAGVWHNWMVAVTRKRPLAAFDH